MLLTYVHLQFIFISHPNIQQSTYRILILQLELQPSEQDVNMIEKIPRVSPSEHRPGGEIIVYSTILTVRWGILLN